MRSLLLFALLSLNGAAFAGERPTFPTEGEAGCSSPVGPDDTAQSLRQRFGDAAKITEIPGPEGESMKAVVLFAKDKAREIDVIFHDAKRTRISGYRLPDEGGKWTVAGLKAGATVEAVEAANGGPFDISGFDWDYGGSVVDFRGGRLAKLAGGCSVSIVFAPRKDTPPELSGDSVKIASTDQRLRAAQAKVLLIMINFPARR